MKSIALVLIGLMLGLGLMLLLPHGGYRLVYAGGQPSGNGDVNASGRIDIADAVYLLTHLFAKGPAPEAIVCPECPACDLCCPSCPPAGLPATGQTVCYDMGENIIDCDTNEFPGQDAFYQAGCPMEGRFIENDDGTVADACTGLVWQQETADIPGDDDDLVTWPEALRYCDELQFAGSSDWRLPNVRELQSIADYGRAFPALDTAFSDAPGTACWSSSSLINFMQRTPSHHAWIVDFGIGEVIDAGKQYSFHVRAVRNAR